VKQSDYMRLCRQSAGLTQEQLAELADVHGGTILNWERGKYSPTLTQMIRVCDALCITLDEYIGRRVC